MATTLTLTSALSFSGKYSTDADLETAAAAIRNVFSQQYVNGVNSGEANTWYADTVTLTGSPTTFNLAGGLTDRFGNAITFTSLREIMVYNKSLTLNVTMSGELPDKFNPDSLDTELRIWPNGIFYYRVPLGVSGATYGIPITASCDTFTLVSSTTCEIDLILIGTR